MAKRISQALVEDVENLVFTGQNTLNELYRRVAGGYPRLSWVAGEKKSRGGRRKHNPVNRSLSDQEMAALREIDRRYPRRGDGNDLVGTNATTFRDAVEASARHYDRTHVHLAIVVNRGKYWLAPDSWIIAAKEWAKYGTPEGHTFTSDGRMVEAEERQERRERKVEAEKPLAGRSGKGGVRGKARKVGAAWMAGWRGED